MKPTGEFLTVRSPTKERSEYLDTLMRMVEAGDINPVIDKKYPLDQVRNAHEYVETGRKKGNVIVKIIEER